MNARQLIATASRLRERDLAVLDGLYQHRFLTRRQIQTLYFANPTTAHGEQPAAIGSPRPAQRRLYRLRDDGLILRRSLARPDGRRDPEPYYCLTPDGAHVVAHRNALQVNEARKRSADALANPLFVRHALAAADLHCALVEAARAHPGHHCLAEWWQGESATQAQFLERGKPMLLRPDGYSRYQADDDIHHLLVEIDLGTMSQPRLAEKLDRYRAYSRSGAWQSRYPVFPKLLLLTTSQQRINNLYRQLEQLPELVLLAASQHELQQRGPLAAIWQQPERPKPRPLLQASA